jgi:hypothetical protein
MFQNLDEALVALNDAVLRLSDVVAVAVARLNELDGVKTEQLAAMQGSLEQMMAKVGELEAAATPVVPEPPVEPTPEA